MNFQVSGEMFKFKNIYGKGVAIYEDIVLQFSNYHQMALSPINSNVKLQVRGGSYISLVGENVLKLRQNTT